MAKRMTSQEKKAERLVQQRVQRATIGLQISLLQIVAFSDRARALIASDIDDVGLAIEMQAFVRDVS